MRMSVNVNMDDRDLIEWSDQREAVVVIDSDRFSEYGCKNVSEKTQKSSTAARHVIERFLEEKRLKEVLFDVFEEELKIKKS